MIIIIIFTIIIIIIIIFIIVIINIFILPITLNVSTIILHFKLTYNSLEVDLDLLKSYNWNL